MDECGIGWRRGGTGGACKFCDGKDRIGRGGERGIGGRDGWWEGVVRKAEGMTKDGALFS